MPEVTQHGGGGIPQCHVSCFFFKYYVYHPQAAGLDAARARGVQSGKPIQHASTAIYPTFITPRAAVTLTQQLTLPSYLTFHAKIITTPFSQGKFQKYGIQRRKFGKANYLSKILSVQKISQYCEENLLKLSFFLRESIKYKESGWGHYNGSKEFFFCSSWLP